MSTPVQTSAGPWRSDVCRARADLETALALVTALVRPGVDGDPADPDEKQHILDARRLAASATAAIERAWLSVRDRGELPELLPVPCTQLARIAGGLIRCKRRGDASHEGKPCTFDVPTALPVLAR